MSVKSKKSEIEARAGLYLLVAEVLHLEVNERILRLLSGSDVIQVLVDLEPECKGYLDRTWTEKDFESAAVAYCSQFILSESPSAPRAAAWLELQQAEEVDSLARKVIDEWKIELPSSYHTLSNDHVSLLLYLSAVIRQKDEQMADEFELYTLRPWVERFSKSLEDAANPLYRVIGKLLGNIL